MIEKDVEVMLDDGLQARAAAQFVQEANRFTADLFLEKDGKRINAKSIMGLMSLAIAKNEHVTLIADGPDEAIAFRVLTSLISKSSED